MNYASVRMRTSGHVATVERTEAGPANLRPDDPHYYYACTCGVCGPPEFDPDTAINQGAEHIAAAHVQEDRHAC